MNRSIRILTGLLSLCVAFGAGAPKSLAAEPYTYTVTFHAGGNGTFPEHGFERFLSVEGSAYEAVRTADGTSIVVSGLAPDAVVGYDAAAAEGAVLLPPDSRYYVKGIRRSGHDNEEAGSTSFRVEKDLDHVVAYGIRGDLTSYTVHYQDGAGNTLLESRTYTGNVGDRPMAGYRYIEGYQPQAYNLTKTLVKNEAENVFTFVYTPVQTGGGGGTGGGGAGGAAGTAGGTAAAETPGGAAGAAGGAATPAGAGGAAGVPGGADAGAPGGAGGADAGAEAGTLLPDEEIPADEGPRDLVDLDDEDTPLADVPSDGSAAGAGLTYGLPVVASVSLILAAALLVLTGIRYRAARRKREDEGDGSDR